jgi:LPXTG-motif cell wall-anchored protein
MSNLNVAGQGRALPMTGFAALPLLVLGAALSIIGSVMSLVRRRDKATQPTK